MKIGIVTFPIQKAGVKPLSNLLEIIFRYTSEISLITGNEGYIFLKMDPRFYVVGIYHTMGKSKISRTLKYIWTQIRISVRLIIRTKNVDTWIFFFGGYGLLLPLVTAKLFGKKTLLLLPEAVVNYPKALKSNLYHSQEILSLFTYTLADKLILYSPCLVHAWDLESYRHKILIAHEHFLDFNIFTVTTPFPDRPPLIGYIGRLSTEKGVQHFVQALPAILNDQQDLRVFIGGDGPLKESIELALLTESLADRVDLPGWISHDDLPHYLNQLRLLVLPSYTEGLPNIMLEAMACGTPVLAAPVGAVPDVIRNGETGFIMENNSPDYIAENVIRVLSSPDLERIADNGRLFVERDFTFEKTVGLWRRILEENGQIGT